jgi:hypothetical protein
MTGSGRVEGLLMTGSVEKQGVAGIPPFMKAFGMGFALI